MPQDTIPLYQATHILSDPYWYWDACFDSQKDWTKILEWENWEREVKRQEELRIWRKRNELLTIRFQEDSNRALTPLALWEAQVRGRLEGMIVCTKS